MPFKEGQSGNPNGRPKGSRNKSNPVQKLQKALANGMDLAELKNNIADVLGDDSEKFTPAQIQKFYQMLIDAELKLMEMDFKYCKEEEEKSSKAGRPKGSGSKPKKNDEDDDDSAIFSLTAE